MPVIIGGIGIGTKSLKKSLEAIPGNHLMYSLQKTAILETSHIIRKVLQSENYNRGEKYQEKWPVTGDNNLIIIIIIIIIIIVNSATG
jgi:hypothetical protein